ncbi:MAG: DUF3990 domain-containing protein [Selenomonas artemidis]
MQAYEKNLFHGSKMVVEHPLREKCRENNDFGKCFYCTESLDLAKEWACQKGSVGIVSAYTLDMTGLSVINLNTEAYHTLNWLATLLQHRYLDDLSDDAQFALDYLIRNFAVDTSTADVVIGYRADDSYFQYALNFLTNQLSIDKLAEAMRLGKLGEQVAIQSNRAFQRLEFQDFYEAEQEYIARYQERDQKARETFRESIRGQILVKDKLTIERIIQEGIKNDDPRLFQSIYHGRTRTSR